MRPQHDVFVLLAAILSGDVELARRAAMESVAANPGSKAKQFYHAWAGILNSRLLGRPDHELMQLGVLKKNRRWRCSPEPSAALAEAFCNRDYATLNKEITKAVQKCQKQAEDLGALTGYEMFLSRDNRVFRIVWPWPEAAFAKLAFRENAKCLALDEFWLPEGFVAW